MSDPDTRIREIKDRHAAALAERARAEHAIATAKANVAFAEDRLAAEFGVRTSDEARTMLAALQAELDDQLVALRAALDEIGGQP